MINLVCPTGHYTAQVPFIAGHANCPVCGMVMVVR